MIEAYPLSWPVDYPRTRSRKNSRFDSTLPRTINLIKDEVRRIGGSRLVISTNIPVKQNGEFRTDWTRFKMDDPGVAVYFTYKDNQVCLCCDTYSKIWENLQAIGRTIYALRQIDRDGVSDFLNRTFTGFIALPEASSSPDCWDVLGISPTKDKNAIILQYRTKAKALHPDSGGDKEAFIELGTAYEAALKQAEN